MGVEFPFEVILFNSYSLTMKSSLVSIVLVVLLSSVTEKSIANDVMEIDEYRHTIKKILNSEGKPIDIASINKTLDKLMFLNQSLNEIDKELYSEYITDVVSLKKLYNTVACKEEDLEEILKFKTNHEPLKLLIEDCEARLIHNCKFSLKVELDWTQLKHESSNNWDKLRSLIGGQNLKFVDFIGKPDETKSLAIEGYRKLLVNDGKFEKSSRECWSRYIDRGKTMIESIRNEICEQDRDFNHFDRLEIFISIAPNDKFFDDMKQDKRERLERLFICRHLATLDADDTMKFIVATRYESNDIENLLFSEKKQRLQPNEVHFLLGVLEKQLKFDTNPTQLAERRNYEKLVKAVESIRIPVESADCNPDEIQQYAGFLLDANDISMYDKYYKLYVPLYVTKCAQIFEQRLTEKLTELTFSRKLVELGSKIGSTLDDSEWCQTQTLDQNKLIPRVANFLESKSDTTELFQGNLAAIDGSVEYLNTLCSNIVSRLDEAIDEIRQMCSALHQSRRVELWNQVSQDNRSLVIGIETCKQVLRTEISQEQIYSTMLAPKHGLNLDSQDPNSLGILAKLRQKIGNVLLP